MDGMYAGENWTEEVRSQFQAAWLVSAGKQSSGQATLRGGGGAPVSVH